MPAETALNALKEKFGDRILSAEGEKVRVAPEIWREVNEFLKETPGLDFAYHCSLTAVDWIAEGQFEIVNIVRSLSLGAALRVSTRIDRAEARIDSLAGVWKGANWPEREAFDLFGVDFKGHPNLTRLMMPEQWKGHPLRKDYVYVEPDWYRKRFDQANAPIKGGAKED